MNISYSSYRFLWKIADWIYPPICAGCAKTNARFCPECQSSVGLVKFPQCPSCGQPLLTNQKSCPECSGQDVFFESLFSWGEYKDPLREAIHALKYKQDLGLADTFSRFLCELLEQKTVDFNLVVPVPLSRNHKKIRGFNQAELIARPIAYKYGIPLATKALIRIKDTVSQIDLSALERNLNLEGAFMGNPAKLKGKRVLVVDDIITTGATMRHCAQALLQAGAVAVYGISIAKTMKNHTSTILPPIPVLDNPIG